MFGNSNNVCHHFLLLQASVSVRTTTNGASSIEEFRLQWGGTVTDLLSTSATSSEVILIFCIFSLPLSVCGRLPTHFLSKWRGFYKRRGLSCSQYTTHTLPFTLQIKDALEKAAGVRCHKKLSAGNMIKDCNVNLFIRNSSFLRFRRQ